MNLDLSRAVRYHEGAFPPRSLDLSRLLEELLAATDALARYDQMLKNLHNSEIFLAPLRGQEALASSRMEGTFSTLEEVFQLQSEPDDPLNMASEYRSEAVETYLYSRALRNAQSAMQGGQPLSIFLIKQIHQVLLSWGRGQRKSPGAFKREQNYVGTHGRSEVSFIPISPEKLDSGMETLLRFTHEGAYPPLLRVALAHVEFEALHPFQDGNGRVGRMLITLMLWHFGVISAPHFYISRYFEENKPQYVERMRAVSAEGDWEGWCAFFLTAVKEQAIQNLRVAQEIRALYEEMKTRFAEILASRWSTQALDYFFAHPVFSNNRFAKQAGIPDPTAARFSRRLLETGLLAIQREASGRRPAVYRFEPLLELLRR